MTGRDQLKNRIGRSLLPDAQKAVRELSEQIYQELMDGVIFFCSPDYDQDLLGKALKETFPCQIIGCTSAGEISPAGYQGGGIVAASISSARLKLHSRLITPLSGYEISDLHHLAESIQKDLVFSETFNREKMFGFLLIDGRSNLEEMYAALLSQQFGWIPIAGGSAGDNLNFSETKVFWEGEFHSNAALFTLFETTLPFHVFQTQHFQPTAKKLVVTEAEPSLRIVHEINAEPAVQAYADLIGVPVSELGSHYFSKHPLMLRIGDDWFVRSVKKAHADGSLSFYCAIDKGLVLTIGEGCDMVAGLDGALKNISGEIPDPGLVLGCDCILRKLEAIDKGLIEALDRRWRDLPIIGFNTYGEQINSVHVNQTLTGVSIGTVPA